MPGICFYFENSDVDVFSGREIDIQAWNYAMQVGGKDMNEMLILNRTNQHIQTPNAQFKFECRQEKEGEITLLPGKTAYFIPPSDLRKSLSLWDFDHDIDWYFFGPAQVFYFEKREQDIIVNIPMNVQIHSIHAANIVMAHRYHVKNKET